MSGIFNRVLAWTKENLLLVGTLSGVVAGIALGFSIKPFQPSPEVQVLLAYPGELFVRALQLMILPCVIFSLFVGAASLDIKSNGRIVAITFGYFILTSLFNAFFGVILALVFHPGDPSVLESTANETLLLASAFAPTRKNTLMDNFLDLGRNIIPNNLFTAFFEQTSTSLNMVNDRVVRSVITRPGTNTMGIITVSIVFGAIMGTMREEGAAVIKAAETMEKLINKTVFGIIWATPVGVASIVCAKILEVENMWGIMAQLALFVATVAVGLFTYQWIIMQLIYFAIIRKNPYKFYMGVLPAALTGFSADSSAAALPVTLRCLDENVKVNSRISHFVVPIGIIVNMDGTALFVCVASIFIAQMNSIALGFGDYITIIITSTTVSIATASAPSASLTMMFIVLNAINAPVRDIGLLFAIDWLVDRLRTTNNILGDCYAAAIVEHYTKSQLEADQPKSNEAAPDGKQFELEAL